MKVVTSASESKQALDALRQRLTRLLGGRPRKHTWTFPGGAGGGARLRTWFFPDVLGGPLVVGIGDKNEWETRTPVLIARSKLEQGITPAVEVNIPATDGTVDRRVGGLFYRSASGRFVLAHRGAKFTVSGAIVPKLEIHKHFSKWMVTIDEEDRHGIGRTVNVIPIGPVGSDAALQLATFADEVVALKDRWRGSSPRSIPTKKPASHSAWRNQLRFPEKLSRIVAASSNSFEYRHGPLQVALRSALGDCTSSRFTIALNQQVDLALLRGDAVVAIFEVKTDLGPQLYAGIGQLFWYRQALAKRSTPLFLVVPRDVRGDPELQIAGAALKRIGIVLLVEESGEFHTSEGSPLRTAMRQAGLPTKGA